MNTTQEKFKYTEQFLSLQGENVHTGKNSLWLRLFQCNLECRGFSQANPADPSTYKNVGNDYDLIDIKVLDDLPVFEYGCDSAYSVSRRYEHLVNQGTAEEICNGLTQILTNQYNPTGSFLHPYSGTQTHFCITGGEPLLRPNQRAIEAVVTEFAKRQNVPRFITIETNGTQKLSNDFKAFLGKLAVINEDEDHEWFWSVSPKLLNVSGEHPDSAIKPEVVMSYLYAASGAGLNSNLTLKFVLTNTQAAWDELDLTVRKFRDAGVASPVWIMPVGASKEQQETAEVKEIVYKALERGYNVSGRLHAHLLGNGMNT